jgi:hypothetical protein
MDITCAPGGIRQLAIYNSDRRGTLSQHFFYIKKNCGYWVEDAKEKKISFFL